MSPMQLRLDGRTLTLEDKSRRFSDEDRAHLGELAQRAASWNRGKGDAFLAEIGRDLHAWLGGWATGLRVPHLTLDVVGEDAVFRDAPWELLHDGQGFLVDAGFEVVRRLVPAAAHAARAPEYGLTVVFMAASPRTHRPGLGRLRHEEEEAAILRAVGEHKLLLSVEETGSARGLGERLSDLAVEAPTPVVHLTSHGTGTPPRLLLENDHGREAPTSAGELLEVVGFRLTEASLVVVNACATAASSSVGSFAASLVQGGVRAALGWSASVSDAQATRFAGKFYERLREGDAVDRALNVARRHLKNQNPGTDWHLARLVAGPTAGGPISRRNGPLPALGAGSRAFGGNRKAQIATRLQFVGRRPHLQAALRALAGGEFAGVLITGLGHQGKSSLAGRLADRHRGPIAVCWGAEEMSAPAILLRVQEALDRAGTSQARADRAELSRQDGGLQAMLQYLLKYEAHPLLLVLDDVDQVLELSATPVRVIDKVEPVLRAVLAAFEQLTTEGQRHRLILTSRVAFRLSSLGGEDLVPRTLREVRLEGMPAVELALLPAALEAADLPADARATCLDASAGNPSLAALLLRLARDLQATGELQRLPSLLAGQPGASPQQAEVDCWMDEVVGVMVDGRLSDPQRDLLRQSAVLPGPVPRAAVLVVLGSATGESQESCRLSI